MIAPCGSRLQRSKTPRQELFTDVLPEFALGCSRVARERSPSDVVRLPEPPRRCRAQTRRASFPRRQCSCFDPVQRFQEQENRIRSTRRSHRLGKAAEFVHHQSCALAGRDPALEREPQMLQRMRQQWAVGSHARVPRARTALCKPRGKIDLHRRFIERRQRQRRQIPRSLHLLQCIHRCKPRRASLA
ncbi:MAG: hypothetical protein FJ256_03915 [Phycisphaerae bacterium]|nr:hypothetical protein [Phycisphaerae bacterium]